MKVFVLLVLALVACSAEVSKYVMIVIEYLASAFLFIYRRISVNKDARTPNQMARNAHSRARYFGTLLIYDNTYNE